MHSAGGLPASVRGLIVGTAVVWFMLELRQSHRRRPEGVKADRGSRLVLGFALGSGAIGATVLARRVPEAAIRPPAVADWIGLCLLWSGIALRIWSIRTLGRYFTFTVETSPDQPVITTGPYRVIRHPSYAALILTIVGVGLFIGNWWSLMRVTAGMTCGVLYRIRVEDHALLRDLGPEYRRYAATHKRLIPSIW